MVESDRIDDEVIAHDADRLRPGLVEDLGQLRQYAGIERQLVLIRMLVGAHLEVAAGLVGQLDVRSQDLLDRIARGNEPGQPGHTRPERGPVEDVQPPGYSESPLNSTFDVRS